MEEINELYRKLERMTFTGCRIKRIEGHYPCKECDGVLCYNYEKGDMKWIEINPGKWVFTRLSKEEIYEIGVKNCKEPNKIKINQLKEQIRKEIIEELDKKLNEIDDNK